jgi:hypothetical protein
MTRSMYVLPSSTLSLHQSLLSFLNRRKFGEAVGWAWKPIEGIGVGDVWASVGLQGLVGHHLRVGKKSCLQL